MNNTFSNGVKMYTGQNTNFENFASRKNRTSCFSERILTQFEKLLHISKSRHFIIQNEEVWFCWIVQLYLK